MSDPAASSPPRVIPHQPRGRDRFLAGLAHAVLRLVMATWRCRVVSEIGVPKAADGPVIFCVWHNRLALSMPVWRRLVRPLSPGRGLVAMISASRDGGLLASVLQRFDVQPVRGSSSRRGRQALLEAVTWMEKGYHAAITPDGPRGPRYSIQPGIIGLAQVTGRPIIPISMHIHWKICTRSWDRFQIPLPFSRCEIFLGEPIRVDREADDAAREVARQKLLAAMNAITRD